MEAEPERTVLRSPYKDPMVATLAVVVSAAVCLTIFQHWRAFDWVSKFLAIVLLLSLVPWSLLLGGKRSRERRDIPGAREAYIWLLLATILFAR